MKKSNVFNSITYCSGSTITTPSLYVPINKTNLGIDGINKNNAIITASFTPGFGSYSTSSTIPYGLIVNKDETLVFTKGNTLVNENHYGKCLTLAGSGNYVYVNDSTGSLDDTLDVDGDDFCISFWYKASTENIGDYNTQIGKWASNLGWLLNNYQMTYNGRTVKAFYLQLNDKLFSGSGGSYLPILTNWNHYCWIIKRDLTSTICYALFNGKVIQTSSAVTMVGTLNNTAAFVIYGENNYSFDIKDFRLFRFGYYSLTVTGDYSTNNLLITTSNSYGIVDTIYNQATQSGTIPTMYRAKYASLLETQCFSFYNANRAMHTSGNTNYNFETGNTTGWTVYGTPSTFAASTTLPYSGSYSCRIVTSAPNEGAYCTFTNLTKDVYYEIKVAIKVVSGSFKILGQTPVSGWSTTDTYNFYQSAITGTSWNVKTYQFRIRNFMPVNTLEVYVFGNGECYFEIVSLRRIGEVACYKFNNNYLDSTTNGNTLSSTGTTGFNNCYLASTNNFTSINVQTGTLAFFLKPSWEGDDNLYHHIFSFDNNSISLKVLKETDNNIYFRYSINNNLYINDIIYSVSGWDKNVNYHLSFIWDYAPTDKIYYTKAFINGNQISTVSGTNRLEFPETLTELPSINIISGSISYSEQIISNLILDSLPYYNTIASSRTSGINDYSSIEYLYNSGTGNVPLCDFNTKMMLVVEN